MKNPLTQPVHLSNNLYKDARSRAAEVGFSTVDEYIADVVSQDLQVQAESFEHLFTPELIADLDKISADIKAGGNSYTLEEVRKHFQKKRNEWLKNRAG